MKMTKERINKDRSIKLSKVKNGEKIQKMSRMLVSCETTLSSPAYAKPETQKKKRETGAKKYFRKYQIFPQVT